MSSKPGLISDNARRAGDPKTVLFTNLPYKEWLKEKPGVFCAPGWFMVYLNSTSAGIPGFSRNDELGTRMVMAYTVVARPSVVRTLRGVNSA